MGGYQRISWQLDAGDQRYEGDQAYVGSGEARLAIHLFNREGVNLFFVVPDDGSSESVVESAYFAIRRDTPCQLIPSEPPFTVRFDDSGPSSLGGSFSGRLACEGFSALSVSGSFQVPKPVAEEED